MTDSDAVLQRLQTILRERNGCFMEIRYNSEECRSELILGENMPTHRIYIDDINIDGDMGQHVIFEVSTTLEYTVHEHEQEYVKSCLTAASGLYPGAVPCLVLFPEGRNRTFFLWYRNQSLAVVNSMTDLDVSFAIESIMLERRFYEFVVTSALSDGRVNRPGQRGGTRIVPTVCNAGTA